jgi:hypothetical protein
MWLNPQLPDGAFDDAFAKLTHPETPMLDARTRPMYQGVFST